MNNSSVIIYYHNLTSTKYPGIGRIGHSEIHDYYQQVVVNAGLALSYKLNVLCVKHTYIDLGNNIIK